MRTGTIRFPLLWGLQQAVLPVITLVVVLWLASHAMTMRWAWEETAGPASGTAELAMPVQGVSASELTDSYHDRRPGGRIHHAIDIFAPAGTPVRAAASGMVVRRSTESLGGRAVYVRTADSSTVYYYAHLDRFASGLTKGTRVETGDLLGTVGTTGNAGTPHLHFAVWKQTDPGPPYADEPVNPYPLLTE
jgi:murein DD-endopeptidase MepM/ murein hydrolase activator NlpD